MLAEQCSVSLIVIWEPSGMLMNVQLRVCLTHSAPAICVSQFIITTEIASPGLLGFYYKGDI